MINLYLIYLIFLLTVFPIFIITRDVVIDCSCFISLLIAVVSFHCLSVYVSVNVAM